MSYVKPGEAYAKMYEAVNSGRYERSLAEYKRPGCLGGVNWEGQQQARRQLLDKFCADLRTAYDVPRPLHVIVLRKAWDFGHSNGLQEVVSFYDSLMDVAEAATNV